MARVEINNLTVRFGEVTAVDRLSLTIGDGELVVYLGPSGCGKTTTLRCIAGLEQATAGEILFDAVRVNDQPPSQRNIAMVFQFVSLYPHLNVRDNIAFPLRARGVAKKAINNKLAWIREIFKLDDVFKRYPLGLPPGVKQKVALARAVVREPNVLLLDEPLSAIDEQFREEMRWELGHLQKQLGFTTVYVTHDQREAMSLADRIVLMNDGAIVQVGTPQAVYAEPNSVFTGYFIGSPGMNFIDIELDERRLLLGRERIPLPFDPALLARLRQRRATNLSLGLRPQDLALVGEGGDGRFQAPIVDCYPVGRERFFDFTIDGRLCQGLDPQRLEQGDDRYIAVSPGKAHFFDKTTGERVVLERA